MRILIINPNTTASMTKSIEVAGKQTAQNASVVAMNPTSGPAAIQGPEDGEAALPGLFALFDEKANDYDAVVIACFDDTGLWHLKDRVKIPVIGIGEAAFHMAMLASVKFSVVTTLAVSIPVIEQNITDYGFAGRCAKVRASGIPVLDLERDKEGSEKRIGEEIEIAMAEDGCNSIVLGCAGMADMAKLMTARFGIPVIDGVASAVLLAEALHANR